MRIYKQRVGEEEQQISREQAIADLERSRYYRKGTVQSIERELEPGNQDDLGSAEIKGYRTPFAYYRFSR